MKILYAVFLKFLKPFPPRSFATEQSLADSILRKYCDNIHLCIKIWPSSQAWLLAAAQQLD